MRQVKLIRESGDAEAPDPSTRPASQINISRLRLRRSATTPAGIRNRNVMVAANTLDRAGVPRALNGYCTPDHRRRVVAGRNPKQEEKR